MTLDQIRNGLQYSRKNGIVPKVKIRKENGHRNAKSGGIETGGNQNSFGITSSEIQPSTIMMIL